MALPEDISDLQGRIRDFINHPRRQYPLLKDPPRWNALCSSLDTVEDTEAAITAYEMAQEPNDVGSRYLMLYGLLQALYVQQNALKELAESLHVPYKHPPAFEEIRKIRHQTAGHPMREGSSKNSKRGKQMSHFLVRNSMVKASYEYMTTHEDGHVDSVPVNVLNLIIRQREQAKNVLEQVVKTFEEAEMEHREKFKDTKLAGLLAPVTDYFVTKVMEATLGDGRAAQPIAQVALNTLCGQVSEFKSQLTERGVLNESSHLKYLFEETEYTIEKLGRYLSEGESVLERQAAYIFTFFLREKMKELRALAEEIDEEYGSKTVEQT